VANQVVRSLVLLLFGVCPILFFTDLTRNPYYTQIALLNIFILGIWLVWLISALRNNAFQWVDSPVNLPLTILFCVAVFSWLNSFYSHPAFIPSIYSEGSRRIIFMLVNMLMVFLIALRAKEFISLRLVLGITYLVVIVASAYGVAQYFGIELIWPRQLNPYGYRPVSTFGNPNFMSSYLVVVMPVMVADYLFGITGFPKAILFIAIHVALAAILATLTRSSWAGLFMGLAIVLFAARKSEKPIRSLLLPLLVAMGVLVLAWPQSGVEYKPIVLDRLIEMKSVTVQTYGSIHQRFLIWLAAWGMVEDHPWFGKGWGCFELFYPFYQGPLLFIKHLMTRTHANNTHNEILEYWSQIGTVGFGVVIWMWVIFFRSGLSVVRRLGPEMRWLGWGIIGGVAGMLIDNLLNVSIHFAVPAFILWWWVGMLMSLDPLNVTIHRIDLTPLWRKSLAVLGAVGIVCLMGRAGAMWAAEVNFFKGFKLSKGGVDLMSAAKYLERAYQWHPLEVNNNYELGNVYARIKNHDKALFMYQRAIDANAGYDEIYFNRATLHMQGGRNEEAIRNYRICLAINPISQPAYNALAGLYFKEFPKYQKDIEKLYLQGVLLFPGDKDMWNNLGYYYTQVDDWASAIPAYEKAVEIDPQFELARKNLEVVRQRVRGASGPAKR
jgi:O-antigen ligase